MPLQKEVDLEKTVAAASGVFRDVCSEEPPYHTAEELWEGLKQGDGGAEAGSDPRGHLWVTWAVYLWAGKPPLADIILSHPPDLT